MPANSPLKFSIVTPSFKQPDWLRLCLASVADQQGDFAIEHIIQDNCSGEAVAAVVAEFPGAQLFAEQDKGMYDAVNHGLKRTTGDICAYLNCDEQYLPGRWPKWPLISSSIPRWMWSSQVVFWCGRTARTSARAPFFPRFTTTRGFAP